MDILTSEEVRALPTPCAGMNDDACDYFNGGCFACRDREICKNQALMTAKQIKEELEKLYPHSLLEMNPFTWDAYWKGKGVE